MSPAHAPPTHQSRRSGRVLPQSSEPHPRVVNGDPQVKAAASRSEQSQAVISDTPGRTNRGGKRRAGPFAKLLHGRSRHKLVERTLVAN
ncbi:hypothetical protein BV898_19315 [Hypsibius exemplaris]|uniref:Uncharacterized protein n=1 Tax=Hypsibius exemplaris TaxID=2072580 RepID=A0A9X6NL85_HYPEX|nr:hypothetical protein BV898_19315 [Hypsibius exemplaris]